MKQFLILPLLVCLFLTGYGQRPQALLQVDTSLIRMGEQAKLKLSLYNASRGSQVTWPTIPDSLLEGKILVVEQSPTDTIAIGEKDQISYVQYRNIVLTGFDSGSYTIGPFYIKVNGDSIASNTLDINIKTFEVDTTKAIKEIKEIEEVPYGFFDWLTDHKSWLLIAIAVLVVIYIALSFIRKKRLATVLSTPPAPPRPAHEIALELLEKIRSGQLWQRTSPKVYYTDISDILRNYIEKRFQILAHEQTTSELMHSLSYSACQQEEKERLKNILQMADMVKFAKQQPDELQALQVLDMSIRFVENTKEVVETEMPEQHV